jgi:hypothetical protein
MNYIPCATCKQAVTDPHKALLIATHIRFPDGVEYYVDWRIVHKGTCDPHDGPWYPLDRYVGQRGLSRFNRHLVFQGALRGTSQEEIDELRDLLSLFEDAETETKAGAPITGLTGRFAILKRDGYRCRICGRTAAEDGVKLEVDHKVPRSKGGADTEDNLWTLCFDCNRGKRASDL